MAINYRELLNSSAFSRQQAEELAKLIDAAIAEAAAGGSTVWGGIGGTLTDQLDLDARFDSVEAGVSSLNSSVSTNAANIATNTAAIAAISTPNVAVLGADVSTTAVSPLRQIVSALTVPVVAGKRYKVKYVLPYNTNDVNNGIILSLNRNVANNAFSFVTQISAGSTASANRAYWSYGAAGTGFGVDFFSPFGHASAAGLGLYIAEGIFMASTVNGNVELHISAETTSGAVTLRAGSFVEYAALP